MKTCQVKEEGTTREVFFRLPKRRIKPDHHQFRSSFVLVVLRNHFPVLLSLPLLWNDPNLGTS